MCSQALWKKKKKKEQVIVFSWKKKKHLARLPYQDMIIADTGQSSVSCKTFVGSNFIRDININK